MAVVVVGIHERAALLERFEKISVPEEDLHKALRQLTDSPHLSEVVLLSTCMRTEVYAVVERFHDGISDIGSWLCARLGEGPFEDTLDAAFARRPEELGDPFELGGGFSCWYDAAAVAHLFEVAAGLDSPILGEGEILRQVRAAASAAHKEHAAGPVLSLLFRHAVEAGKRARSETAIARGTTSLAHAVVELAADRALGLADARVLLVGAGEMATGIAKALSGRSDLTGEVVVANRSSERGRSVADLVAGRAVGLADLPEEIAAADVVITATAAGEVLLSRERLSTIVERRSPGRARPLVVVDAAVPRDVDPAASAIEGLELLDMEDVRRFAEEQMAGRSAEVPRVLEVLAEELERYRTTASGRLAAPVVAALHDRAEALRRAELERVASQLSELPPEVRDLAEVLTRRITAKLLHDPTVRLKEAAGSPRGERLAEALRALFDL